MQPHRTLPRTLLVLCWLIIVGGLLLGYLNGYSLDSLDKQADLWLYWGPMIFIGLFCAITLLSIPGTPMAMLGGALFGPGWGAFYTIIGAMAGALISFLMAKSFAADWVDSRLSQRGGRLQSIKEGVDQSGWRFVAFVRFVPFIPFALLNYALGLTRISLWHFMWASIVFMLPGTYAYTYLGSLGSTMAEAPLQEWIGQLLLGAGLLVLTIVLPCFLKRNKYLK